MVTRTVNRNGPGGHSFNLLAQVVDAVLQPMGFRVESLPGGQSYVDQNGLVALKLANHAPSAATFSIRREYLTGKLARLVQILQPIEYAPHPEVPFRFFRVTIGNATLLECVRLIGAAIWNRRSGATSPPVIKEPTVEDVYAELERGGI